MSLAHIAQIKVIPQFKNLVKAIYCKAEKTNFQSHY